MHAKSNRKTLPVQKSTYLGLPVINHRGLLDIDYLNSIHKVLNNAVDEYPRVCAIRIDLRFPPFLTSNKSHVISKFTDSLKSQIKADILRKQKRGGRRHSCNLRLIWAKERCSSSNSHYHLVLLFNKDVYYCLGRYDSDQMNGSKRIKKAWASAIGLTVEETANLVDFPKNNTYYIDSNSDDFDEQFAALFYRASYLAKVETKEYGDGSKQFGCSLR